MDVAAPIAVIAALLGPLLTYLVAARRLSGKIATSDATDLWRESSSIRADYQRRIEELNGVVRRCEERIETLERRNEALHVENDSLRLQVDAHERTIDGLRRENIKLRKRVAELESA